MKKSEFLTLLEEKSDLDPGDLQLDTTLAGSEIWDSILILGFIATVDGKFDIELDPEQVANAATMNDAIALIDVNWANEDE